jgi:hypothetical protein
MSTVVVVAATANKEIVTPITVLTMVGPLRRLKLSAFFEVAVAVPVIAFWADISKIIYFFLFSFLLLLLVLLLLNYNNEINNKKY